MKNKQRFGILYINHAGYYNNRKADISLLIDLYKRPYGHTGKMPVKEFVSKRAAAAHAKETIAKNPSPYRHFKVVKLEDPDLYSLRLRTFWYLKKIYPKGFGFAFYGDTSPPDEFDFRVSHLIMRRGIGCGMGYPYNSEIGFEQVGLIQLDRKPVGIIRVHYKADFENNTMVSHYTVAGMDGGAFCGIRPTSRRYYYAYSAHAAAVRMLRKSHYNAKGN